MTIHFSFCSFNEILFPLFISVEPSDEQPIPKTLLFIASLCQIEHSLITILFEEFFNDSKDREFQFWVEG